MASSSGSSSTHPVELSDALKDMLSGNPRMTEDEDDHEDGEDADEGEGVQGEGAGDGSTEKTKKKKKKSKAGKLASKVKNALPGQGGQDIPAPILQEVMKHVEAEVDGEQVDQEQVRKALQAMKLMDMLNGKSLPGNTGKNKDEKGDFKFWKTQPVTQFGEAPADADEEEGPIDAPKTVADVRQTPYPLPGGFEWSTVDVEDHAQMTELQTLLLENYVEDVDATMRFAYSLEFLNWALKPPGYVKEWHIGVRVIKTGKLVGFISGIPVHLRIRDFNSSEINFLCVHKKLRSKRLAPVLIKEVTRRCNLVEVWQAVYTAGVVLPVPFATTRYFHRNLNPKKLIDVGFAQLPRSMTMARCIKHYAMPKTTSIAGFREMTLEDLPAVAGLLKRYLARFDVAPLYDEEEFKHWFISGMGTGQPDAQGRRAGQVTYCYVVEDPTTHAITDLVSFYSLPSSVLDSVKYPTVDAAYLYYYATEAAFPSTSGTSSSSSALAESSEPETNKRLSDRLKEVIEDLLTVAQNSGFDVVNSLTSMDNNLFLAEHKFGAGSGYLRFYMYNYRMKPVEGGFPNSSALSGVGLVML